jgi:hypothetical protein
MRFGKFGEFAIIYAAVYTTLIIDPFTNPVFGRINASNIIPGAFHMKIFGP